MISGSDVLEFKDKRRSIDLRHGICGVRGPWWKRRLKHHWSDFQARYEMPTKVCLRCGTEITWDEWHNAWTDWEERNPR